MARPWVRTGPGAGLAAALFLSALPAVAGTPPAASAAAAPTASAQERPLAPLPEVPAVVVPKPDAADLEELDALLGRLRSADAGVRDTAVREILEVQPRLVPAIHVRLTELADKADRDEMKKVLQGMRRKARGAVRAQMHAEGTKGKIKTPDYLEIVVGDQADPKSETWQNLVSVLGMSRMLVQVGTVQAARELIDIYVHFGEFLRIDTQLQLDKLGDKAVAALIETRRHPAPKIAHWAARELDSLGKAIPSEAVRTSDYEVLADVLLAYGRTRDPDAARIVISFANTERAQVRQAARQSVVMMGEVASWQLRDTYEDIVGKKPPRDWDWKRTARELFGEYDRQRLAQVYKLFDAGIAAQKSGDLQKMRTAFDQVLARSPRFEHRDEMVPGYLAYARKVADDDRDNAILALRRAARLAPDDASRKPVQSLLLTLEGETLLDKGIADQTFFRRAIELEPADTRARDDLARIERGELKRRTPVLRYATAGAIGAVALVAIAFIALRRRTPSAPDPEPDETRPDADATPADAGASPPDPEVGGSPPDPEDPPTEASTSPPAPEDARAAAHDTPPVPRAVPAATGGTPADPGDAPPAAPEVRARPGDAAASPDADVPGAPTKDGNATADPAAGRAAQPSSPGDEPDERS